LKIPAKIWNNRKVKNQYEGQLILHVLKDEGIMLGFSSGTSVATVVTTGFLPAEQTSDNMTKSFSLIIYVCYRVVLLVEHELDGEQQEEQQHEEQLNEVTRKLILREDELFSQDSHSEEEEDQLQKDYESLSIQIWMAVHNTFTPLSLNDKHLEVLRNAVDSIQQQEMQDQRWRDCSKDKVPSWRPQRWLSTHNKLLQTMVESRLTEATEDDSDEAKQLSSAVKKQVCQMGKRLKEDLLTVVRTVKDCYPMKMDILNVYGGLYHQTFSDRLAKLTSSGLEVDDCSYVLFWVNHYYPERSVEDLVKANPSNLHSVIKAQLVCEQQLRDYITGQTGGLSEEQRGRCLDTLTALRDCGYQCFTCPLHGKIKVYLGPLWTSPWVGGSLAVVDPLLNFLNQQLDDLSDLKPACKQVLVCKLHQNVVVQYVKKTMKTRMKSRQQQVAGSQRMVEDAKKIGSFFEEEGCGEASWLSEMLCSLAEILRLQDPASIHLEVVNLALKFPDFSGAHVSALLSLKFGLSALDVRSIRASVEENRPLDVSANQSPLFFSRVKLKWIDKKINQMWIKS
ncbi:hypothetical protein GOODEAATRI_008986, partial [Goodea atripinnis]